MAVPGTEWRKSTLIKYLLSKSLPCIEWWVNDYIRGSRKIQIWINTKGIREREDQLHESQVYFLYTFICPRYLGDPKMVIFFKLWQGIFMGKNVSNRFPTFLPPIIIWDLKEDRFVWHKIIIYLPNVPVWNLEAIHANQGPGTLSLPEDKTIKLRWLLKLGLRGRSQLY